MFIVKVPGVNGDGKTEGCEKAGNAILTFLKGIHVNEQGKPIDYRLLDLEEIHLDNSNLKLTNELIYKNALETFETKSRTVFLGGDHSVSYSLVEAFNEYCNNENKEPCLIVLDARPDCADSDKLDFPNSTAASTVASHKDKNVKNNSLNLPTNRSWLKQLIEGGFPTENILLVGIRDCGLEEIEFVKRHNLKIVSMNRFLEDAQDTCDAITEFSAGRETYVSIDAEVADPAFAPAVAVPEPGGLTSREMIYLIQRINKMKNLKAVDITEINSEKDKQFEGKTVELGAKLLSELL
jgi:arginase family enzyme